MWAGLGPALSQIFLLQHGPRGRVWGGTWPRCRLVVPDVGGHHKVREKMPWSSMVGKCRVSGRKGWGSAG